MSHGWPDEAPRSEQRPKFIFDFLFNIFGAADGGARRDNIKDPEIKEGSWPAGRAEEGAADAHAASLSVLIGSMGSTSISMRLQG